MTCCKSHKGGQVSRRQFGMGMGALALGAGAVPMSRMSRAFAQGADWKAHAGGELRILMANHWWTDNLSEYLPEFEEMTGMQVTFDILAEDNYYQKAAVELSAGTRNYDALMVGNLQAGQYIAADWLYPLGELLNDSSIIDPDWYQIDDIFASGRAAGSANGKLYALPISQEAEVVMYRTDLAAQAGISGLASLDDLVAAATALHGDGMSGIVGRGRRGIDIVWIWTGFLLSNGGDFFVDGQPAVDSDAAKEAADIYLNRLLKDAGPQGTANMSWLEASDVFKNGNAAFYPDASGLLAVALDKEKSAIHENVGIFAWPGQGGNAPGPNYWFWLFGIPAQVRNPAAAALFTSWATSPELSLRIGAAAGSPVPRQSVWDDPGFAAFYPGDSAAEIARTLASVQPERVPYSDPNFNPVVDAIGVELTNALTGSKDVDTAMEDAQDAVIRVLGG